MCHDEPDAPPDGRSSAADTGRYHWKANALFRPYTRAQCRLIRRMEALRFSGQEADEWLRQNFGTAPVNSLRDQACQRGLDVLRETVNKKRGSASRRPAPSATKGSTSKRPPILRARAFVLEDEIGRMRARLACSGNSLGLKLYDPAGHVRLAIGLTSDGAEPSIHLFDRDERCRVVLTIHDREPVVILTDKAGRTLAKLP